MDIDLLIGIELDAHQGYLMPRLAKLWSEMGHRVRVSNIAEADGKADIGILHVNRSVVRADQISPLALEKPLINGRALDITKRRVSTLLCDRDDDYSGPVIIKTNLNYWGVPERRLESRRQSIVERVRRRLPWRVGRRLRLHHYPVLQRISDVPNWVWTSSELVVEKFVPERDRDLFVTRHWVFLGEREYGFCKWNEDHVVRRGDPVHFELSEHVPQALRERRKELGFDYGKFDWVVHDGKPVLLDANKTPGLSRISRDHPHTMELLASGIDDFI